jgi:uncharacterized membrane protein YhdT
VSSSSLSQTLRAHEKAIWLFIILLVAAWVRLTGLDFQSYWYDELFSAYISNPDHAVGRVVRLTLEDVHPPLFQLTMWLSYQLFGYTEWAGRLPSALAGVITVAVIYLLGRDLFSKRAGLYAAALAIFNFYFVYYAQEARSYAFLYLFCSLSFLFFVRALRSDSKLNVLAYVIATLALLYTHYFGFVLLVAQGLCAILYLQRTGWNNRALLVRGLGAAAVVLVVISPMFPYMLGDAAREEFWIPQPDYSFLYDYFLAYTGSLGVASMLALLLLAGIAGLGVTGSASWQRTGVLMLLIWIVMGYLLPWARGFTGQPVITDRNTIMLLPAIFVLAGYGLTLLPGLAVQRAFGAALVLWSAYYLIIEQEYYTAITKNQFREAAAAMVAFEPELPVYTLKINDSKYNVYFIQQGSALRAADASEVPPMLEAGTAPALFWMADGHGRTFDPDVPAGFGLIETGRYRFRGTVAALLVNPDAATTVQLDAGETEDEFVSNDVSLTSHTHLLVALDPAIRDEVSGQATVTIVDNSGNVSLQQTKDVGSMSALFALDGLSENGQLRVTVPGDVAPQVWLLSTP